MSLFVRLPLKTLACLGLLICSGCLGTSTETTPQGQRIKIVATTGMVADLAQQVAGSHADVVKLIGSGVDPHLFRATRRDVKQLQEADVVFYSGLLLEGRMQDALQQVDRANRPVVAITSSLDKSYLRSPPEFEGHFDPHVWMDVTAWSQCIDVIVETLSKRDPAHADEFQQNARNYQAELEKLDRYVREVVASIPESQRVLVTAHDAFGYFGRAYGIEVRSVQGVTTESEAGVHDVNRLVDFLAERKIPAIFVESSVNEKNIRAVIEGTQSRNVAVRIGAELFSDAMGAEGTYEGTYIGMIDHNATRIARALGGTAPETGLNGRLAPESDDAKRGGGMWLVLPGAITPGLLAVLLFSLLVACRRGSGRLSVSFVSCFSLFPRRGICPLE